MRSARRWLAPALLGLVAAASAFQLQVTRQEGVDLPGADLPSQAAPARSFEDCAARCVGNVACAAFTYNAGNGVCYPKSRAGPAQPFPGAVSGIVAGRFNPAPNTGPGVATPNACSVGGEGKCPGCSISCSPGQRPVCTAPIEGVAAQCQRDAWCRCAPQ